MRRSGVFLLPFLLALVSLPTHSAAPGAGVSPMDVRLTGIQGDVAVTTLDGDVKGPPPSYGALCLEEGDSIRTQAGASAEIAFKDGSLIRLEENTAVHLRRLSPQNTFLALQNGVLLAKVQFEKKEGQQFSVVTPSAVAAVRGTEFVVEETGSITRVGVLDEGHVVVQSPGFKKEIVMHCNQETQVKPGTPPRDT